MQGQGPGSGQEQALPKYHLNEQRADAILRPLALTLSEMESRAQHYLDRLNLVDDDREAVAAAHRALATASAEMNRLWRARVATPRRGGEKG